MAILNTSPEAAKLELALRACRKSFNAFRWFINDDLIDGWFQREVCRVLEEYYYALMAGERPKLVIMAPPQHGKSVMINDFVLWLLGKRPDTKVIYGSFSDRLGVRANLRIQRIIDAPYYNLVFPKTRIGGRNAVSMSAKSQRNRDLIEIVDHKGYFRNTTVGGSVTGESLDLGVVDDPLKGRAEANSATIREKTWEWMTDDFLTRFSKDAGFLMILTRWHVDDPAGRMKEEWGDDVKVLSFPAIAVEADQFREAGEALFPQHKPIEFLLERKRLLADTSWESLYQQSPFIKSGGMFPTERITMIDFPPLRTDILRSVRYWDKAATKDGDGAYTAGVLMHQLRDGRFVIGHVVRKRLGSLDRETAIKSQAVTDGFITEIGVEQEPGSGGKESAEATIRNLRGFNIYADRPTGDKETRAEPFAATVQGGNLMMVRGDWNQAYLDELDQFPNGKWKDQVDASSGAFSRLTGDLYDMELLVG